MFFEELDSFGFRLKVLALVRPPYSYACSAMQENIKSGKFNSLVVLNQPSSHVSQHETLTKPLFRNRNSTKNIWKNINFQSFSKALAHFNGPAAFCLEQLSIPVIWESIRHDSDFRSNESLNNSQVRAMNLINKKFHTQQSRKSAVKILSESWGKAWPSLTEVVSG